MIGFACCGSFCTLKKALKELEKLAKEYEVQGIVSERVAATDTRFQRAAEVLTSMEALTGKQVFQTVKEAEIIGPQKLFDALVICPCTGNTLAKLASGITDSTVTMAAKAHLRNEKPLVLALATNDALSVNLKNIGELTQRKHVYFVPMRQDDPLGKPNSLVADFSLLAETLQAALQGRQIPKIFRG